MHIRKRRPPVVLFGEVEGILLSAVVCIKELLDRFDD
jgi:hypothetical protein